MELRQNTKNKITYNRITSELGEKFYDDSPLQLEWYNDVEIILQDLAYGYIDSIECIHKLNRLGFSIGDIARNIIGDVEQARRETITKRDAYMEGELS